MDELTQAQELATLIHEKICRFNHVDACGWDYEDWDGYTTKRYLKVANKMLEKTDFETAKQVISCLP